MKYKFSTTAASRLATCHSDLQKIMNLAIELTDMDFGIAEGHRSIERQQQMYKDGKSKIDGITRKGKHNYSPSLAVDIYAFVNGKASWAVADLMFLNGIITAAAKILKAQGEITHDIRLGANWDRDGEFLTDQSFDDLPHIELV
jgi:peptidoglycan L-alanyl-D-glutamate endopeptidase CwlK